MRIAQFPFIGSIVARWRTRKHRDTIICNNCLRRTRLITSPYTPKPECRYCEHCARELANLDDPGRIIVTFGNVALAPQGKMFVLADGDFEEFDRAKMALDVTDIYIDVAAYSPLLLEKCLLHLNNYPPAHGVKAIRIFHTGNMEDLTPNIKALLQLTHIEPVNESDIQATSQLDNPKPTFTYCTEHPNRAYFPLQAHCPWCGWFALPFIIAISDKRSEVRRAAVDALGNIHDICVIAPLITAYSDQSQSVRSAAKNALVKIGSPVLSAGLDRLKNSFMFEQDQIIIDVLGEIGDECAVKPLLNVLSSYPYFFTSYKKAAKNALVKIGSPAVNALLDALNNAFEDVRIRIVIAETLGEIGDVRAVDSLLAALNDPLENEPMMRNADNELLDQNSKPLFFTLAFHKKFRIAVVNALGQIGDPRALDELIAFLKCSTEERRKAAKDAIIKIYQAQEQKP